MVSLQEWCLEVLHLNVYECTWDIALSTIVRWQAAWLERNGSKINWKGDTLTQAARELGYE